MGTIYKYVKFLINNPSLFFVLERVLISYFLLDNE
jgi:hypothetical protein